MNTLTLKKISKIAMVTGYILFIIILLFSINNLKFNTLGLFRIVVFFLAPYFLFYGNVKKISKEDENIILDSGWKRILFLFIICFAFLYVISYIFLFQELFFKYTGVNSIAAIVGSSAFFNSTISIINKKSKNRKLQ